MAHYAIIDENNIVVQVITGRNEDEVIDGISDWEEYYGNFHGMKCKRTSYNTLGGKHYSHETGKWSKARQFRGNYATIGCIYDEERDAFIEPQPYDSWIFDEETYTWNPPIERPSDCEGCMWNESEQRWE